MPNDSSLRNAGGKTAPEVREMFSRVARRYDLLNHLLSLGMDIRWRRTAAREVVGLGAGAVLADLCAGTGDLALAFHQAAPESPIIALDFTPEMLALAQAKATSRGIPSPLVSAADGSMAPGQKGIAFCLADALALPLSDSSVAVASVAFGLRNVADLDAGLREMVRVVRPGGKVLVLEFTRPAGWLFGPLYMFYFRRILPLLGRLIAAAAGDAYRYLPQSVQAFAGPEEMCARMAAAGLQDVRATPLTFGVVHLYVGIK